MQHASTLKRAIVVALAAGVLVGCQPCTDTVCPAQTFLLLTSGTCIASVATECIVVATSCTQATVAPPQNDASTQACTVDATLADGTTLTFTVDFTYRGDDKCCGPHYDISPPAVVVGQAPADAGLDARPE